MTRARFSLLELIIVLVIMSLVLSIVIFRQRLIPAGIQTKQAMKTVSIAFHTASNRALSTGSTMKLTFNFDSSKVQIVSVGKPGGGGRASSSSGGQSPASPVERHFKKYGNFKLPETVQLDENRLPADWNPDELTTFYFYPNGEAVGPTLPIVVNEMIQVDIDVQRLTGKPLYHEQDYD